MDVHLLETYAPQLDPALILAIWQDSVDIKSAKSVLDSLAKGSHYGDKYSKYEGESANEEESPIEALSYLHIGAEGTEEEKLQILSTQLPQTPLNDLRFTLRKHNGNLELAKSEIKQRSRAYETIESENESSSPFTQKRGRQKSRKDEIKNSQVRRSSSAPEQSRWNATADSIRWLAERFRMSQARVASAYHKYPSDTRAFVLESLARRSYSSSERQLQKSPSFQDSLLNLCEIFPNIVPDNLQNILQATNDDFLSALEVCGFIENHYLTPYVPPSTLKLEIDSVRTDVRSHVKDHDEEREVIDTNDALWAAEHYRQQKTNVMQNAAQAYRQSKGNKLMGAAAAYYADLGRTYDAKARMYDTEAARAMVNQQSSENVLDLHRATVQQALSFTSQNLNAWWARTPVQPYSGGKKALQSYSIITGQGRHSSSGSSRLRPVIRMYLTRNKWRYGERGGEFEVFGVL